MFRRLVAVLAAVLLLPAAAAPAAEPPPGSVWEEHYFPSGDGTVLHADVLRPAHLPKEARTPVLLTVSPYLNHAESGGGPSDRFYDFLELSGALAKGYTYVMVDLRGFGGSGGCNDWGGPGERMDAKAAVEWAAAQPWSTGRVGMVGKSYDAWTGLMAIAEKPKGLAAVLAMEPVYSGYRYLYMDGVRFLNSVATPTVFQAYDAQPGAPSDSVEYHVNGTGPNAACYAANIGQQQIDDPAHAFWQARDLLPPARGSATPLFLTQGFLETNTRPDGAFAFFNGMTGPRRAWFGQFDHIRGWEPQMGRRTFMDEAMRFLDHHVAQVAPAPADPPVTVQDGDGRWRAETAWPPTDVIAYEAPLRAGVYEDDGGNAGDGPGAGNGLWTISQPLPHPARLTGEPQVEVEVTGAPARANLVVNVYDIAPDNRATLISRAAMLLRRGPATARPELYGQDWRLPAGHRIGVLVSGANRDWWEHVPTQTTVEVAGGRVRLPFLRYARPDALDGEPGPRLEGFRGSSPFDVPPETIAEAQSAFELPPPMADAPPGVLPAPATPAPARRRPPLTARARRRGMRIVVTGRAPTGARLRVAVLRGRRTLARRQVRPVRRARYAVRLRVRDRRALTVRVTGRTRGGTRLRAAARIR